MAGTTGFEPATSDVTGRRSNQLSYVPANCRNPQNTMIVERIARQLPLRVRKFQLRSQFPLCQSSRMERDTLVELAVLHVLRFNPRARMERPPARG